MHTHWIKRTLMTLHVYCLLSFLHDAWRRSEKDPCLFWWVVAPLTFLCSMTSAASFFWPSTLGCLFNLLCQRWVSEKLSVESLQDLHLFGGEHQPPVGTNHWLVLACKSLHWPSMWLCASHHLFVVLFFYTVHNWKWCKTTDHSLTKI